MGREGGVRVRVRVWVGGVVIVNVQVVGIHPPHQFHLTGGV